MKYPGTNKLGLNLFVFLLFLLFLRQCRHHLLQTDVAIGRLGFLLILLLFLLLRGFCLYCCVDCSFSRSNLHLLADFVLILLLFLLGWLAIRINRRVDSCVCSSFLYSAFILCLPFLLLFLLFLFLALLRSLLHRL